MIWACFAAIGPGRLTDFESTMNSSVDQRVLKSHVRPPVWQTKSWWNRAMISNTAANLEQNIWKRKESRFCNGPVKVQTSVWSKYWGLQVLGELCEKKTKKKTLQTSMNWSNVKKVGHKSSITTWEINRRCLLRVHAAINVLQAAGSWSYFNLLLINNSGIRCVFKHLRLELGKDQLIYIVLICKTLELKEVDFHFPMNVKLNPGHQNSPCFFF